MLKPIKERKQIFLPISSFEDRALLTVSLLPVIIAQLIETSMHCNIQELRFKSWTPNLFASKVSWTKYEIKKLSHQN